MEREDIGTIVKTTPNYAIVSMTIGDSPKSFFFSQAIFYAFGIKCDGNLKNILETGLEVSLYYRTVCGSKYYITAVWLGEKPECLQKSSTFLNHMYGQKGTVNRVLDEQHVLLEWNNCDLFVLLSNRSVFRDGVELRGESNIGVGDIVNFDAVAKNCRVDQNKYGNLCYSATCAWIGSREPRLVDRFGLAEGGLEYGLDEEFPNGRIVYGSVSVIPNNVIAFVDVVTQPLLGKVLLFRSSLRQKCDRIQDEIALGDQLCMRLCVGCIYPRRSQWFVVEAWKDGYEISLNDYDSLGEEHLTDADGVTNGSYKNLSVESEASIKALNPAIDRSSMHCPDNFCDTHTKKLSLLEVLYCDPPLRSAIIPFSDTAIIRYHGFKIYVEPSAVYIDMSLCTEKSFHELVSGGNVVHFEAIPASNDQGIGVTHDATCVWVGKKPSVVKVMESLPTRKLSLFEYTGRIFVGFVFKYCLPKIALVYVEAEETTVTVHVTQFVTTRHPPENDLRDHCITNFVKLKQFVEFKVQSVPSCPKLLCAYDVKVLDRDASENVALVPSPELSAASSVASKRQKDLNSNIPSTEPEKPNAVTMESTVSKETPWIVVGSACKVAPFEKLADDQTVFVLGLTGELTSQESVKIKTEHFPGLTFTWQSSVVNDLPPSLQEVTCRRVRFDAELIRPTVTDGCQSFKVKRVWDYGNTRPAADLCLTRELVYAGPLTLLPTELYYATISQIPFHNSAIAMFKDVPVLVSSESLVTTNNFNPSYSHIDLFVKIGQGVVVEVNKQHVLDGQMYFRAVKCYCSTKKVNRNSPLTRNNNSSETDTRSFSNIWKLDECLQKGNIKCKKGRYFINLTSSKHYGRKADLHSSTGAQFFVDGLLTDPKKLPEFQSREITCYIARKNVRHFKSSPDLEIGVTCYWIGEEPSPFTVLSETLSVPRKLVTQNKYYQGVVESFPLPTHALCKIGTVPVLVPFSTVKDVPVEDINLKIGDLVVMRVQEAIVDRKTYISSIQTSVKLTLDQVVLKNLIGTVVKVPSPIGVIKLDNSTIEVCFEWCHVHTSEKTFIKRKTIWPWYKRMKDIVIVGAQARVTAGKVKVKDKAYIVREVWIENS